VTFTGVHLAEQPPLTSTEQSPEASMSILPQSLGEAMAGEAKSENGRVKRPRINRDRRIGASP
jgi:hypothetical protein